MPGNWLHYNWIWRIRQTNFEIGQGKVRLQMFLRGRTSLLFQRERDNYYI